MKKLANWIVDKKVLVLLVTSVLVVVAVFGMLHTNVNYDMSKYLADDSSVRKGMNLMKEEYGDIAVITVMFDNLTEQEQLARKDELKEIKNVKSVVYNQEDEDYQKENHSKYVLTVSADTYSEEAAEVLDTIKDRYGDAAYISGPVADNQMMVSTLSEEMPLIGGIAIVIIFVILFLFCDSWIEPFLYMTCIGIAVVLNMGSNALLPSVSFMTYSVGSLLQMALSMDYSIMLMNRFNQEKRKTPNSALAMKNALANAFSAISSSSVTTIAGLLVLLFMRFKIGKDMGIVLAKGVLTSLICIFTILPGLVVLFDTPLAKTHKKALSLNMKPVMKFVGKIRFVSIPLIIAVVAVAYFIKGGLDISYVKTFDNPEQAKIEEAFGIDNQCVLIYDSAENPETVAEYVSWAENNEDVNSVQDYSNTIAKPYTYKELADEMDCSEDEAKMIFQLYKDNQDDSPYKKITLYDLICYMDDEIVGNKIYADMMDEEQVNDITDAREELEDGRKDIKDGEKEVKDGKKKIANAEKELADGEQEIADNEKKLADSEKKLRDAEKAISDNEKKIAQNEKTLVSGKKQIQSSEKTIKENENKIAQSENQLQAAREQMKKAGMTEEMITAQLGEKEKELASAKAQLAAGKKTLEQKKKELATGEKKIKKAKKQLAAGKKKLVKNKTKLENGKRKLEKAKKDLENGRQELADKKQELKDGKKELSDSKDLYEKPMTAKELAKEMNQDEEDVEDMLKIRRMTMLDVEGDTITLEELLNFIADDVLTDETYANAIDEGMRADINDGLVQLDEAREQIVGEKYNRMLISVAYPSEGDDTFACMDKLNQKAGDTFENEAYLVGDSAMGFEMDEGFGDEMNLVTVLTILAIFAVVWITFRSLTGSVCLVAIIQAAVFITMAVVTFQGNSINYIALILVQCILMGSTIDYAILLFDNYREMRQSKDKFPALGEAMNRSIRTILTSSLIFIGVCLTVSALMTQKIIAQTCMMIAYGAICSVFMVIFILPAVLLLIDRFIIRKKKGK